MAREINRFEDLLELQKAREITSMIYRTTDKASFRKDWALMSQMKRCAISIQSNIAEGFERSSNKEYIHFLDIAKASAAELRSQMYTALDLNFVSKEEFDNLTENLIHISRMLNKHINYLREYGKRGQA